MKNLKQKQDNVLTKIKNFFFVRQNEKTQVEENRNVDTNTNEYHEYLGYYLKTTRWQRC